MLRKIVTPISCCCGTTQHCFRYLALAARLVPDDTRIGLFNKKVVPSSVEYKKFQRLQADVVSLTNDVRPDQTNEIVKRFQTYISHNPRSHYVSTALIKIMAKTFSNQGEMEYCKELLTLFRRLGRHKTNEFQYTSLYNCYVLSMNNCPDGNQAKETVLAFLKTEKFGAFHPLIQENLLRVFLKLDMKEELMEHLSKTSTNKVGMSAEIVLVITRELIAQDTGKAVEFFEEHSTLIDVGGMNADTYALLGIVINQLYPPLPVKEIATFTKSPLKPLRTIRHLTIPGSIYNYNLCKVYEVLLHITSKRNVPKLFRLIGGRWGLTRQLMHVTRNEYAVTAQYIVALCQAYSITVDKTFWKYLIKAFFYVEDETVPGKTTRRLVRVDYHQFTDFYNSIKIYTLPTDTWCMLIDLTLPHHLELILDDLQNIGLMNDDIFSSFLSRCEKSPVSDAFKEKVQDMSKFYTYCERRK